MTAPLQSSSNVYTQPLSVKIWLKINFATIRITHPFSPQRTTRLRLELSLLVFFYYGKMSAIPLERFKFSFQGRKPFAVSTNRARDRSRTYTVMANGRSSNVRNRGCVDGRRCCRNELLLAREHSYIDCFEFLS